jgi:hypothetical protein
MIEKLEWKIESGVNVQLYHTHEKINEIVDAVNDLQKLDSVKWFVENGLMVEGKPLETLRQQEPEMKLWKVFFEACGKCHYEFAVAENALQAVKKFEGIIGYAISGCAEFESIKGYRIKLEKIEE